jgi:hypothetical protein
MASSGRNGNGSQFFITVKEAPRYNGKHVVFGRVMSGMKTVLEVAKHGTKRGRPLNDIRISACGKLWHFFRLSAILNKLVLISQWSTNVLISIDSIRFFENAASRILKKK